MARSQTQALAKSLDRWSHWFKVRNEEFGSWKWEDTHGHWVHTLYLYSGRSKHIHQPPFLHHHSFHEVLCPTHVHLRVPGDCHCRFANNKKHRVRQNCPVKDAEVAETFCLTSSFAWGRWALWLPAGSSCGLTLGSMWLTQWSLHPQLCNPTLLIRDHNTVWLSWVQTRTEKPFHQWESCGWKLPLKILRGHFGWYDGN